MITPSRLAKVIASFDTVVNESIPAGRNLALNGASGGIDIATAVIAFFGRLHVAVATHLGTGRSFGNAHILHIATHESLRARAFAGDGVNFRNARA